MGVQIFKKPGSHVKILGTGRVAWNQFSTEGPPVLGTTIKNVVAAATCCIPLYEGSLILTKRVVV